MRRVERHPLVGSYIELINLEDDEEERHCIPRDAAPMLLDVLRAIHVFPFSFSFSSSVRTRGSFFFFFFSYKPQALSSEVGAVLFPSVATLGTVAN
jgi:hypothetical protein